MTKFHLDPSDLEMGTCYECRGIVNADKTLSFGELTKYDAGFDLDSYEQFF